MKFWSIFGKILSSSCFKWQNYTKYLNISYNRVYATKLKVSKRRANKYQYGGEKAQMLIMGAILVAVAIVSLSVIVTEVSNIPTAVPLEKGYALYPVYSNIREKFGFALDDLVSGNRSSSTSWVYEAFNVTKGAFYITEAQHMRYFDAELVDVNIYSNVVDVSVRLSLHNDRCMISEKVLYELSV